MSDLQLPCFLMDFTFSTNEEGLLLGAIGPVGLLPTSSKPQMRFFPVMFVLADAEDEEAHRLCIQLFRQAAPDQNVELTDAFLDCACLKTATLECGDSVFLHRCLQHTKTNIKSEARRKDSVSGRPRLQNGELLQILLDCVEFSATLPTDVEFHTYWSSIFMRLSNSELPTDWNEPAFCQYLQTHIFDLSGPCIKASWCYGVGSVPLGFTTYATNSIERSHRLLKGLLDKN